MSYNRNFRVTWTSINSQNLFSFVCYAIMSLILLYKTMLQFIRVSIFLKTPVKMEYFYQKWLLLQGVNTQACCHSLHKILVLWYVLLLFHLLLLNTKVWLCDAHHFFSEWNLCNHWMFHHQIWMETDIASKVWVRYYFLFPFLLPHMLKSTRVVFIHHT